jgi:hypothetical protein
MFIQFVTCSGQIEFVPAAAHPRMGLSEVGAGVRFAAIFATA